MTRILGRRSSETVAAPRSWVVGASATYVVTLVLAYLVFISPQFSDGGLVNKLAGVDSLIVAVILAVVPALWLPATARRPSDAGLWLVYTVGYVPSIVVPPFILGSGWGLLPLWVALASSFVVVVIVADRVQLHLPRVNLSPTAFGLLLVLLAVGGLVVMLILFGLPDGLPLWIDGAVMERPRIVLGGGSRSWKVIAPPSILLTLPNVEVVEGLAAVAPPRPTE